MGYRDRIERLLDSLASLNMLVIWSAAYRFAEGRGLETFSTRKLMWMDLTGSISPGSIPELSLGSAGHANRAWEAPDFFPPLRTGAQGWQLGISVGKWVQSFWWLQLASGVPEGRWQACSSLTRSQLNRVDKSTSEQKSHQCLVPCSETVPWIDGGLGRCIPGPQSCPQCSGCARLWKKVSLCLLEDYDSIWPR